MRSRNIAFERDITRNAAHGLVDPSRLIEHAETRATTLSGEYVTDPMLVVGGRNRPEDVREELADARNHLVWWLEDNLNDPTVACKWRALRLIAVAYSELLQEA